MLIYPWMWEKRDGETMDERDLRLFLDAHVGDIPCLACGASIRGRAGISWRGPAYSMVLCGACVDHTVGGLMRDAAELYDGEATGSGAMFTPGNLLGLIGDLQNKNLACLRHISALEREKAVGGNESRPKLRFWTARELCADHPKDYESALDCVAGSEALLSLALDYLNQCPEFSMRKLGKMAKVRQRVQDFIEDVLDAEAQVAGAELCKATS